MVFFAASWIVPRVAADGTPTKYYFQSKVFDSKYAQFSCDVLKKNYSTNAMDTPLPTGPLCESISFKSLMYPGLPAVNSIPGFFSRALVAAHTFSNFRLHLYLKAGSCIETLLSCRLTVSLGSWASVSGTSNAKNQFKTTVLVDSKVEVFDTQITTPAGMEIVVLAGEGLSIAFGDIAGGEESYSQPIIQFGDAAHAGYIETDSVNLEGQPIPELSLPSVVLAISLLATFAFMTRRGVSESVMPTKSPASHNSLWRVSASTLL